jgi:glutamyl-tRNA reductase
MGKYTIKVGDKSISIDTTAAVNKAKDYVSDKISDFMGSKEDLSAAEAAKKLRNRNERVEQQLNEAIPQNANPGNVFETDYTKE